MDKTLQGWQFHVSFSNTLRANQLGKINDWVIIHYNHTGGDRNRKFGKATIVTETHGAREGERVIRGRETEYFTSQSEMAM